MAITRSAKFAIECAGDGVATSFDFVIATLPFWMIPAGPDGVASPIFSLGTNKPTDVINVYTNTPSAPSVSAASITTLGTILHVVFDVAPANGLSFTVVGTFIF